MKRKLLIGYIVFISLFCANGDIMKSNLAGRNISYIEDAQEEPLPDGLVAIEYLESGIAQYIDLGIYLQGNDVIDMKFVNTSDTTGWGQGIGFYSNASSTDYFMCGIRGQPNKQGCLYIDCIRKNGKNLSMLLQGTYGELQHLHIESGNSYLDSILNTVTWDELLPSDLSFCLFARHYINGSGTVTIYPGYCKGSKIQTFSITRNGVKIIDLVACRVDNVGYMYDRVSGNLFGNNGTGNFIIGPDKE